MQKRTILVTGGAGFIGSNFILYWMEKYPDDVLVNFDKLTYAGNPENLKSVKSLPNYHFIKGDICDEHAIAGAMQDVDIVVHFAAESHVDRSITGPAVFLETNIIGTQKLLAAALKAGVTRFHHISTDEVFGSLDLSDARKFSESTTYNPRSPYAASKAASDHLVRVYYSTYGLPVTITNCSNNYGPYQHPEKLIPLAITNLLEGKKAPLYGDGKYVRDWLYVTDHCKAIDLVLSDGKIGETYCVGGTTRDITNREVLDKILELLGKDESCIETVKDRPGHDRKYAVDFSKIKNELGWEPLHSFEQWLGSTVEWYKKNEAWWKKLKGSQFDEYYKKQYTAL
jgi:dTDP-glucose 4,6-dehydratase